MSYVVVMLALTYFIRQVLSPKRGIFHGALMDQPQGWPARLQIVWYPLAVAFPLALAMLASLGYFYTAGELTYQMVDTIWLILGIVTVKMLVLRWLILTRRKLALQVAREKRAAIREALEAAHTEEEMGMVAVEKEALDLASIDVQTRKLLNVGAVLSAAVGAWLIWSEVLPALGILDQISVWQTTLSIDGVVKVMPITLADLGLAVVIAVLTAVAAKNLPGVLELAILQRSGLDTGSRYAAKMLTQYLIIAVGFILVFQTVGFNWSQIQWLVAALGVGLGFGLQEIFGNFISGLIILFERPIRVGDIVTVGDTTGIVTRIRIRATTITNWDRQELLVPNKEFITNRLLNWTLTDQTNRIEINVGLAYGSDVKLALALLAEIAAENEHILDDPQPLITFEGFGENALALVLRAYLSSLEHRLATITALHQTIHEKFNDAGLVIAFPQRDVHLDTSRPLDIRIHRQAREFSSRNRPIDDAGGAT
jgi:potassium efflux system protein